MRGLRQTHMAPSSGKLTGGLLLCLVLAACGGTSHDHLTTTSGSTAPPKGCKATLAVTETSTGSAVCVIRGGTVTLTLHPDRIGGQPWTGVAAAAPLRPGTVSAPSPDGVVHATYLAGGVGHATITARRKNCPASAAPGTVGCHSMQSFLLNVTIV